MSDGILPLLDTDGDGPPTLSCGNCGEFSIRVPDAEHIWEIRVDCPECGSHSVLAQGVSSYDRE